ncbi:uncharacterized protein K460DRAFT_277487 [Cucurbitaria berberidis CBS 394.84]|uniref:ceramidase n=1 Tax=Cucurbitaria berberidis CBS 394.84 TaxID=1168544 RepID=A0A9P4LA06_9PLEO|nr:uncharacterized protein K460DRAFT_277487 [Cucurbitaria berberidis CBS 394.84]KAF1847851.1 hypothetical protein K460DRAFT_277487 [Cucurbitaria berberidis CBS 394.84]
MPPALRPRNIKGRAQCSAPSTIETPNLSDVPKEEPSAIDRKPPVYTIDLSLPPSQRYAHVAHDFKSTVGELAQLFDDVLDPIRPSMVPRCFFHFLAWVFLRRIFSKEQTKELRGMSKVLGVPMYLLVAYNVFLDLLMGCTSGGVLVKDHAFSKSSMMHFRTLDWGMPILRNAIVQYDFVEQLDGKVIATTIGYVGFVGVLTGVKRDLSVSLNFRPYHNHPGWTIGNFLYYWHLLLVLLGFRPSISTILRGFLIPETVPIKQDGPTHNDSAISFQLAARPPFSLSDPNSNLQNMLTTAAYLIFCTGEETLILEKDLHTARISRSFAFITVTNHDTSYEASSHAQSQHAAHTQTKQPFLGIGMQDLIDESIHRKACLVQKWEAHQQRQKRIFVRDDVHPDARRMGEATAVGIRVQKLKKWMLEYPVSNEETHFVCIMDPDEGVVKWVRCFEEGDIEGENESDL